MSVHDGSVTAVSDLEAVIKVTTPWNNQPVTNGETLVGLSGGASATVHFIIVNLDQGPAPHFAVKATIRNGSGADVVPPMLVEEPGTGAAPSWFGWSLPPVGVSHGAGKKKYVCELEVFPGGLDASVSNNKAKFTFFLDGIPVFHPSPATV